MMNSIARDVCESRVSSAITTIRLAILECKKSIEELGKEKSSKSELMAYAYLIGMESILNDLDNVWRNAE